MPQQPDAIVSSHVGNVLEAGSFKNQWLNFSLYLPNFIYLRKRSAALSRWCRWLLPGVERLQRNEEPLGGTVVSTQFLANGNAYQTTFVEWNKADLLTMLRTFPLAHGYSSDALPQLAGTYASDPTAPQQGATLDAPGRRHFYRGLGSSDILRMLREWNVLS
jgi:hypothetical protein